MLKDLQELPVVHYTCVLPLSCQITTDNPSYADIKSHFNLSDIPDFSCTISWYFNENVHALTQDGIESLSTDSSVASTDITTELDKIICLPCNIAVITRLENLMPQLSYVSKDEARIIGKYQLSDKDILIVPRKMAKDVKYSNLYHCGVKVIFHDDTDVYDAAMDTLDLMRRETLTLSAQMKSPNFVDALNEIAQLYPHVFLSFAAFNNTAKSLWRYVYTSERFSEICLRILLGYDERLSLHIDTKLICFKHFVDLVNMFLKEIIRMPISLEHKAYVINKIYAQSKWFNLFLLEMKLNRRGMTMLPMLAENATFRSELLTRLENLPLAELFIIANRIYLGSYDTQNCGSFSVQDNEFIFDVTATRKNIDNLTEVSAMAYDSELVSKTFSLDGQCFKYNDFVNYFFKIFGIINMITLALPNYICSSPEEDAEPSKTFANMLYHHTLLNSKMPKLKGKGIEEGESEVAGVVLLLRN